MIHVQDIGELTLDISTIIYLFSYIPQLIHNRHQKNLNELSLYFHDLLLFSFLTDIIYGLGMKMPWQYILVSLVGTVSLLIQHIQLFRLNKSRRLIVNSSLFLLLVLYAGILLIMNQPNRSLFILVGYASEGAGVIYCLPQILKNIDSRAAIALSGFYLGLEMASTLCDNVSAWFLSWPLPSKLGACFSLIVLLVLISQRLALVKSVTAIERS